MFAHAQKFLKFNLYKYNILLLYTLVHEIFTKMKKMEQRGNKMREKKMRENKTHAKIS